MTRDLSDLEHLLDAAEVLRDIQARRPAIALFHSEIALSATGRTAVFRGHYDGAPAVLTLFHGEDHAERARRQKRALERLEAMLADGPFRIAPLVGSWPGEGVTVTADVAGESLEAAIAAAATPGERDALLSDAGEWLARIVAASQRQVVFGGRHWAQAATRKLGRVGAHQGRPLADALATRIEALLPTVAGKPVTQAQSHGDFRPATLVRADGALCGIGLQSLHALPVVRDLARFLVALHLAHPRPGGRQRFGVGAKDIEALAAPLTILDRRERALHLPFFIGIELADVLGRGDLGPAEEAAVQGAVSHFLKGEAAPLL
ncbi:phosphotransferase [Rhodovulum euryhalinum]|uniref:Aminoglycoside phosphotransferase domain-containing protein n=1 Tax=Rhodovulum euryhalinum TaxID=35805 RepID=A0A4R2KFT8_9RHOB|nr:phosphotransferase [Rhodovulum euryhalinum]TCO69276.1 hypothetical protein EV655_1164 [Rhodovulum euryhalinum]